MGDVHVLPLVGHDLPEYPAQPVPRAKARVYKDGLYWTWSHRCGPWLRQGGEPFGSHASALFFALRHLGRC